MPKSYKSSFGREAVDQNVEVLYHSETRNESHRASFGRERSPLSEDAGSLEPARHSELLSLPIFPRTSNRTPDFDIKHVMKSKVLSEPFTGGGTTFVELLRMLQEEHDREIKSIRSALEVELEGMRNELMRSRRDLASQSHKNLGLVNSETSLMKSPLKSNSRIPSEEDWQNAAEPEMCFTPTHTTWDDEGMSQFARDHKSHELATIKRFLSDRQAISSVNLFKFPKYDDSLIPSWRKKLIGIIQRQAFDTFCVSMILTNSLVLGLQIDYTSRRDENPFKAPLVFRMIDRVYTVIFVAELMIRLAAFQLSFFYRPGWAWNIFDLVVVSTDACQTIAEYVVLQDGSALGNFTALRMLRVLRITRAIRVVRLVRFFRELRMMVFSVMRCGTSLMWSMLMFCVIIYIFSIFLMNAVGLHTYEHRDDALYGHYRLYWSTLPSSMWSLFQCMTGGVSWAEVGDPLTQVGWVYGATLGFFMFFTIFVVTNIITGIFVDTAIQSAQSDRDEVIMEQLDGRDAARMELQVVFEQADHDQSGTLSSAEFEAHLKDEKVRAHLNSIGLQVDEARALFMLLDMDHSDELGIEEFLFGCMRLKGAATSIDLATLMFEHKRLFEGFKKFHNDVIVGLGLIHGKLEQGPSVSPTPVNGNGSALENRLHKKSPRSVCLPTCSLSEHKSEVFKGDVGPEHYSWELPMNEYVRTLNGSWEETLI